MSARARESARRRQRRAERLAKAERDWIIGHGDQEFTGPEGHNVALTEDTMKLACYFARRCIARYAYRRQMIADLEQLLLSPDWEPSTTPVAGQTVGATT